MLIKTDSVDSRKLARSLHSSELTYPHGRELEARTLLRFRDCIVKELSRMKQRVKSLLHFYGIRYPSRFERSGTHQSRAGDRDDNRPVSPCGNEGHQTFLELGQVCRVTSGLSSCPIPAERRTTRVR